jgi:hypothetical protein
MRISYFIQVKDVKMNLQDKDELFSAQEIFIMI